MFSMISIVFIVYCVTAAMTGSTLLPRPLASALYEIIPRIREEGDYECDRSADELTLLSIPSVFRPSTHVLSKIAIRITPSR
ncbi:MAG: hypothetical protein KAG97_06795 [Victivallales bacterium]|nr:hypothetical protein [Victivallales bacterium]